MARIDTFLAIRDIAREGQIPEHQSLARAAQIPRGSKLGDPELVNRAVEAPGNDSRPGSVQFGMALSLYFLTDRVLLRLHCA